MKKALFVISLVGLLLLTNQCANRGIGPQGGPRDTLPPVLIQATPENYTLHFNARNIELLFDEYIQLDNPNTKVFISPPQKQMPVIKAIGKKVLIAFEEDLQDSTTYTIDFGGAIQDNNEKNPLADFAYSFSTGDHIDTFEIAGHVINALTLSPMTNIIVGLHSDFRDRTFLKKPFEKIGQTDTSGHFTIRNIAEGKYHIFGLNEGSKDYIYQPGEGVALYDSIITPTASQQMVADTFWFDPFTIDTIISYTQTIYEPSDLLLFYFEEDFQRLFINRIQREQRNKFSFTFSAPQPTMPKIKEITILKDESGTKHFKPFLGKTLWQNNPTFDTITCWLLDSTVMLADTLAMAITYWKSDSLYQLFEQTDTLFAVYREPRLSEKNKALLLQKEQNRKINFQLNISDKFDFFSTVMLHTDYPIASYYMDSIQLQQQEDTVWNSLTFNLIPLDSAYTQYLIQYEWEPDEQYRLVIDSATFYDIYDKTNEPKEFTFATNSLETYASLLVKMKDFDPQARIQLLDNNENVVRELPAQEQGTKFENLPAQIYYLRIYLDWNEDGQWTTGSVAQRRKPEPVFYFPQPLSLRANWDFEETIDTSIPITEQRPQELRKNGSTNQ